MFSGPDGLDFAEANVAAERFHLAPGGNVGVGTATPTARLHVVGNIHAESTITQSSDRNKKKNIVPTDVTDTLERVLSLPVHHWTYKTEADQVRHVGPMAQDFHAAFGLGANDVTIATVDAAGVALAAIQGLNKVVDDKQKRISELEDRLAQLEKLVNGLAIQ